MSSINEVAKRAGVSTATVSRALSRPDLVTPQTRRTVLQAVKSLGYSPNSAAKHLRTRRSGNILVTVPDISNPFFSLILQGIEDEALRKGYAVLLGDTQHDPRREARYALMLMRKEADGLIFLGHRLPRPAARTGARSCAPTRADCQRLRVQPSIRRAERAHRQRDGRHGGDGPSLSTGPPPHWHRDGPARQPTEPRSVGGRQITRAGRAGRARPHRRPGRFFDRSRRGGGRAAADRREPPTAMFCFNDEMAMGAIEAANRRAVGVPGDLSIMGFDDIRFAKHMHPPLTTIAQPMRQIGEGTVRMLVDILAGRRIVPLSVTLPHALIVRSSTGQVPRSRRGAATQGRPGTSAGPPAPPNPAGPIASRERRAIGFDSRHPHGINARICCNRLQQGPRGG